MIMFKSTSSSGTKRFDAGHRAEMIFVSVLFACPASAPRNERGIGDLSTILKRMDSLGKTALYPSHSPIPQVLLFAFFFLYALERQITESKNDQQYMPSPAGPASALMVIQTQLLLQLLVALLDPEPFVKETNHLQSRHVLGHITEEVPELIFPVILLSSLDDQPDFLMSGSFPIALSGKYPSGYRLNHQGSIQTISPDLQMLPVSFSDTFSQFRDLDRQGIRLDQLRVFSLSSSFLLRGIGLNKNRRLHKTLRIRVNADDIALLPVIEPLAKIRYVSIPTVCHHHPVRRPVGSGLINQIQGHLPLLPVMDIHRHVGLLSHVDTFRIIRIIPGLRNKKLHRVWPGEPLTRVGQTDPNLTVVNLPKRSAILSGHTDTMATFLRKSRIINNQYSLRIGGLRKHPSPVFAKCAVTVPLYLCQQPLHPPFRGVDLLRHRLDRPPVPLPHQPHDITLRQLSGFRSLNVRRIHRHVVVYPEKYGFFFHESCISHPSQRCKIICRSRSKLLGLKHNTIDDSYNLGLCYLQIENIQKAYECFSKVEELNPNDTGAWFGLMNIFFKKQDTDKTIKYCDKLINAKQHVEEAVRKKSMILSFEGALQKLKKVEVECYKQKPHVDTIT